MCKDVLSVSKGRCGSTVSTQEENFSVLYIIGENFDKFMRHGMSNLILRQKVFGQILHNIPVPQVVREIFF